MSERLILITGCSGGGKSTLVEALSVSGYATVREPGRRIIADEIPNNGSALPWVDMHAFAQRALQMATTDLKDALEKPGLVFFDRGQIDAATALEHMGEPSVVETLGTTQHYARQVFVAPPWRELFKTDRDRRHDFDAAVSEYGRILSSLDILGYEIIMLPKTNVEARVIFVLEQLEIR